MICVDRIGISGLTQAPYDASIHRLQASGAMAEGLLYPERSARCCCLP